VTGITTIDDVFIDEVTYSRIADNVATGHGLTLYGTPFDLHPPAVFGLYALVIKLFGLHGNILEVLFALRPFVALCGALSCGLVYILISRVVNWQVGTVAAAIVALDPFEIFYDDHVMLEAPAQLAAVAAVLLLVLTLKVKSSRQSWTLTVLGGLAAGVSMCSKEYFGLALALMLLLCVATGWSLKRIQAATALVIMLASYVLSQILVMLTGGFATWWDQVGSGVRRLIGAEQVTGFNAATVHVSLLSRVAANASHFGVTYVLLVSGAIAGLAVLIAAFRRRQQWRVRAGGRTRACVLVSTWAFAAACYLAYATLFGTLEEQMYYLLLMPGICALVIWVSRLGLSWQRVATVVLAAFLVIDSAVWIAVHRTSDDEYRQMATWAQTHLPAGSTVSVTDDTAQFILQGVNLGQWATLPEIKQHHVDYLLLSTNLVSQGYGIGTVAFEQYLDAHAKLAFKANGPSDGSLEIFDVRAITGAR
jgi:4-amino-4-deoxy-L-arabinose transferase-like glycosyltransferase